MATKIVGLDLGTHTVKVCEMISTFRNFELVGYGTEPVVSESGGSPDFADIAVAAKTLLERRGLLGETVMCALPPGLASSTLLELPFDQPKKIEAVLPFQLDEAIPLDVEDVVFDYQVVNRHENGTATVLCGFVRQDYLSELLSALEGQGIDPKRVTLGPLSYYNLYEHLFTSGANVSKAVLDLGHSHSTLTIFDDKGPKILRDISVGGRALTQEIARSFQLDLAEAELAKLGEAMIKPTGAQGADSGERSALMDASCRTALSPLVSELRRTLASHEMRSGIEIDTLFITGGTSQMPGLAQFLESALRIDVRTLNCLDVPFNRLQIERDQNAPFASKALALATQAFARSHRNQINLRKGDLAYTGDFGFMRGRMIAVALAVIAMIILSSMAAITKKRVLEAQHTQLQSQVVKLSTVLLGVESDDVDSLLATVAENQTSGGKGVPETSAFEMLSQISEMVESDLKVDVDRIEFDLDRKNMIIRGKTGSAGDVERIVDALRKTKCFKQIKKERNEQSVDERRRFRLSATSTCS